MKRVKEFVRQSIRSAGYDLVPFKPTHMGESPLHDIHTLIGPKKSLLIFDVGANFGQSAREFKGMFADSSIHCFEPSPSTYAQLEKNCAAWRLKDVTTWNNGVGSQNAKLTLLENEKPDMSSFLSPDEFCDGQITKKSEVDVITLDEFVAKQDISFIDILKTDTQGYDSEVLKGAEGLLRDGRIGMVLTEVIFSKQYVGSAPFDEMFRFLTERDYSLVAFYKQHFQKRLLSWTDMLFINKKYMEGTVQGSDAKG
ncbi:2-O-methyltransferase NoeI [Symmachiella dynata]|uniref:FkbM family methyltransferase n=1 Tax=Symmachiella dynata TaxID=2527995 RepID=UPI00118AA495|nr:FkbM family methyltransferase [Symmachiella dynata]QDT47852.1 2-O-methyltransferase NoeI [Symmachiella dynata]